VSGFTVGAGLLLLSLLVPWMLQRGVLSRVRNVRGWVFVAGLVVLFLAEGVFQAVDLIVLDFPGPRGGCVWASTNKPLL